MKCLIVSLAVVTLFVAGPAQAQYSDAVQVHWVEMAGPDSLYAMDGLIHRTVVSSDREHQTTTGFGDLQITFYSKGACLEQICKMAEQYIAKNFSVPQDPNGPPSWQQLSAGTFTGDCNVSGPCGQFNCSFSATPVFFSAYFSCTVPPDSAAGLCDGDFADCSTNAVFQGMGPGTIMGDGTLIEDFAPDLICASDVGMMINFDPSLTFETIQTVEADYTVTRVSETLIHIEAEMTTRVGTGVPAASAWGLFVLGFLLLVAGAVLIVRRRRLAAS